MELQLALMCDDARIDPEGKLDIHGVFNDLYAPGFPAKHTMTLVVVIEWAHTDEGRFTFRIELEDPDRNPTLTVEGHTDVDARDPSRSPPRTRLLLPLQDVVFPKAGPYRFHVTVKGEKLGGPFLYLMEQSEPPAPIVPERQVLGNDA